MNDKIPVCGGGSEGCLVDEVEAARAGDEALEVRGIWTGEGGTSSKC